MPIENLPSDGKDLVTQALKLADRGMVRAAEARLKRLRSDPIWTTKADAALMIIKDSANVSDINQSEIDLNEPEENVYVVSAIVSTYNDECFIRGCLDDLLSQTLGNRLEIIVIDSGSQQDEGAIVAEYRKKHSNIVYIRTERESVYSAWNRGVQMARGKYLTNANTDDRHRRDALETLARALDDKPDIAVVFADSLVTQIPNETFEHNNAKGVLSWPEYSQDELETRCCIGPQPMWRREIHDEIGYFNDRYKSAGDYDFWLRVSDLYSMLHIDQVLGLYLERPTSLERQGNTSLIETADIQNRRRELKRKRQYLNTKPPEPKEENRNTDLQSDSYQPAISVLIPAYNSTDYIIEAVNSALEQSRPPDEIVIIDDGSTDEIAETINAVNSPVIRLVRKDHSGRAATRNRAVAETRSEFIVWLDADDMLQPGVLDRYCKILEETKDLDIIYGDIAITDATLNPQRMITYHDWHGYNRELLARMVWGNAVPHGGSLIRKMCYKRYGEYDESLPRSEDYDWFCRAVKTARMKHAGMTTLNWRWHDRELQAGELPEELSLDVKVIAKMVRANDLRDLFPDIQWEGGQHETAEAIAFLRLGQRMLQLGDKPSAIGYLEMSLSKAPNMDVEKLLGELSDTVTEEPVRIRSEPRLPIQDQDRPLRILLAVHSFPPGGVAGTELYTLGLAKALKQRGHEVTVMHSIINRREPDCNLSRSMFEGIDVVKVNIDPPPNMIRGFKNEELGKVVEKFLRLNDFDVAHFQHLLCISASALIAASKAGLATFFTVHDTWLICEQSHLIMPDKSYCHAGPESVDKCVQCALQRYDLHDDEDEPHLFYGLALRRQFLKKALQHVDTLIVPTEFIRDRLTRHGMSHPRTILQPLGLSPIPSVEPKLADNGRVRLTFLGNIFPTKGLDILVAALNRIPNAEFELNIFGKIADQIYFDSTMKLLDPQIRKVYHGSYTPDDLPYIFAMTDLTVIPSRAENYPTVVRESLQCGVPVMAPRVGGIPELIKDGVNGMLFNLADVYDLTRKLSTVFADPSILTKFEAGIGPVRGIGEDADDLIALYRQAVRTDQIAEAGVLAGLAD